MKVQRGEETKLKKIWSVGSSTVKKVDYKVQFYYEIAIENISLLFKITSNHIPKHIVQTWVFQQQFPNNLILNSVTKHIFPNFGH